MSNGVAPDGKRRRINRRIKGTKADAERALTALLRELDSGMLAEGRQSLVAYMRDEWLPAVTAVSKRGRALSPTTRAKYQGTIDKVAPIIGNVALQDLRPHHIERFRDVLLAEGLAGVTVSDAMRVLCQALAKAEARGYVAKNPAAPHLVNRPAIQQPKFTVITAAVAARILDAVRSTEWDAAVHLSLGMGLRRGEVCALRWDDIDGTTLHVRRAIQHADGECHIGPPKSEAGERSLAMPDFVMAAVRRHKAAQAQRLLACGITPTFVVDNGAGDHPCPPVFSKRWARFATDHGFGTAPNKVTYHTLRHGCATQLLAAKVPDAVAIRILGHSDTKILGRYQDVVDDLLVEAAAAMDGVLGGGR
jgi:integrase